MDGDETSIRLLNWTKGSKPAERLAALILKSDGFQVDPSHPLGGRDGKMDALCQKDGIKSVAATYFPNGQQRFSEVKKKFTDDLTGVVLNQAEGFVFVTNQKLTLKERQELTTVADKTPTEIYHLERLTHLLNTPINYGLRLEHLGIKILEEEYLAFQAQRDNEYYERLKELNDRLDSSLDKIQEKTDTLVGYATGQNGFVEIMPMLVSNTDLRLGIHNSSDFPAYDIVGNYIDLDTEWVMDLLKMPYEPFRRPGVTFVVPTLYPHKLFPEAVRFDLSNRGFLNVNISLKTRGKTTMHEMRVIIDGRPKIALKTIIHDESPKYSVPDDFPGYDPESPQGVFGYSPPLPKEFLNRLTKSG